MAKFRVVVRGMSERLEFELEVSADTAEELGDLITEGVAEVEAVLFGYDEVAKLKEKKEGGA